MRRRTGGLVSSFLLVLASSPLAAQTGQRLSIQVSGLGAQLGGDEFADYGSGFGFEAQLRYNPSAFSLGAGFQLTTHSYDLEYREAGVTWLGTNMLLSGIFLEPRYVISTGSASFAPYLAARLSFLSEVESSDFTADGVTVPIEFSASGFTLNAGGGLLVRLTNRANLDLGVTFGQTSFQGEYTFKIDGEVVSQQDLEDAGLVLNQPGSGTSLITRIGIAIGLGR
jgi:hypothetical protein